MSSKLHFVGIAGSGMSALAQFHVMSGGRATGSDRLLDLGELSELQEALAALGIRLFPQDGRGIEADTESIVVSAAIEPDNPDMAMARKKNVPILLRSDFLAQTAARLRTLAVAGTSGKSTVTAMIYEILQATGHSPSVINGGNLIRLKNQGLFGNAFCGSSDLLVIEADESDGTLVQYKPWLGLLLNMGKDHKELPELMAMFEAFRRNSKMSLVNCDAKNLRAFHSGSITFGFSGGDILGKNLRIDADTLGFSIQGVPFQLPVTGRYNAENALAAAAGCLQLGIRLEESAQALLKYPGVSRRFETVGSLKGVEVIDDYAHNPDKIQAALAAAHLRAKRILSVYQPHGFAPTRFLKEDLIRAFASSLGPEDILWMPDIYYAGGTAVRDISSRDIIEPLAVSGKKAYYIPKREDIVAQVSGQARSGDLVLVMGARDPSLGDFARRLLTRLQA